MDDYEIIRLKYFDFLTGGNDIDINDSDIKIKLKEIDEAVREYTNKRKENAHYIFEDLKISVEDYSGGSYEMTNTFMRLSVMSVAYNTKGSMNYKSGSVKDVILSSLDSMNKHKYNVDSEQTGNWWDWKIGSPIEILKCLVLMYDHISEELRSGYVAALKRFIQIDSPINPGDANDLWIYSNNVMTSVIDKDEEAITDLMSEVNDKFFQYAGEENRGGKNGFYRDGSYIMHNFYPYTGSYGCSCIEHMAKLAYLVDGTAWQIRDENKAVMLEWVKKSYIPVIYNGAMLDMARGRSMSREKEDCHLIGHVVIRSIFLLSELYDPETSAKLKCVVKYHALADTYRSIFRGEDQINNNNNLFFIRGIKKVVCDTEIIPVRHTPAHHSFGRMNRTVHIRENYCFGVSMHSDRVYNYEICNGENTKGWHMSDGMTYLYNGDLGQYSEDYWCTVDAFRLAGTTVVKGSAVPCAKPNGSDIAGGAVLNDLYGGACMELRPFGQTLTARKSWFMFDDEIAALGSGISSEVECVETVIETRKISAENRFASANDGNITRWAHISGNAPGSDIGYYFPSGENIRVIRESRKGKWSDINGLSLSDDAEAAKKYYEEGYFTILKDHGSSSANDGYEYIILPNKTAEQIKDYAENPAVEIKENTKNVHAVYHKTLQITGANFFEDGENKTGWIKCDKRACVLAQEKDGVLTFSASDPTQKNNIITFELELDASRILLCDRQIQVTQITPSVKFAVQTTSNADSRHIIKILINQGKEL